MAYSLKEIGDSAVLFDLLEGLDQEAALEDKRAAWAERAESIREAVLEAMGPFPERIQPEVEWLESTQVEGIVLQKLNYTSWDGDRVPAYMIARPDVLEGGQTVPGIMALHQTVPQGKDEVAGVSGRPDMRFGWELASRGFVVFAPDVLSAGERTYPGMKPYQTAPFQERYPAWSMMGKMLYDHRLGLDVLQSLSSVDGTRIGAIGHSLGGYNAFLLAAFDDRVKATVSSCGFSTFAGDPNPGRWGLRPEWFSHMPKVSDYLRDGTIPFEFHQAAAIAAPVPFFNWSTQQDAIFPHWPAIASGLLRIGEVYQFLEAEPESFVSLLGVGPHSFPYYAREAAFAWLERRLR